MRGTPHIYDPNAARLHTLVAEGTRRPLTPHESREVRNLRRALGRKEAARRTENARKAALWGWA